MKTVQGGHRRVWRFANILFDEARWQLIVGGTPVEIENKPLELLQELLEHAGDVVTKEQLFEAAWPDVTVVEASLATAISKLRAAIGDSDRQIIATVPRLGYRLAVSVDMEVIEAERFRFDFRAGDSVPRRPLWRLLRPLGQGDRNDVWLAEQRKTGERRVFKFASTPQRLQALKREATLARILAGSLGQRPDLARVLEWNFDATPMFIESSFGGDDLILWASRQGGLAAVPLERRLAIVASAARTIAAAHSVGVLHKDIKPGNLLIDDAGQVRLVDFGSGRLLDQARLANLNMSGIGLTQTGPIGSDSRTGTFGYLAPELLQGAAPTIQSDVHALGVLLFQMVVGDFARLPNAGWEADVADPLLRADIAAAADGQPERRLTTAEALAERLEQLDTRRAAAAREAEQASRLALAEAAQARARARRPWVMAAVAALMIGIAGTGYQAFEARNQRDEARRQQAIATQTFRFLADDFLGRADPTLADSSRETVAEAARRASGDLEGRFADQPLIAGRLHLALARAFAARADYPEARRQFARAKTLLARAPGGRSDVALAMLQEIIADAGAADETGPPRAVQLLAAARKQLGTLDRLSPPLDAWAARAEGAVAIGSSNDPAGAIKAFTQAAALSDREPADFSPADRLRIRQNLVYAMLRNGQGAAAEPAARALIARAASSLGPNHPDTLNIRLNLAQAYMLQGKYQAAVDETSALLPLVEARFGPDHPRVIRILATRVDVLKSLGRLVEAEKDGQRFWRTAARVNGKRSFDAIAGRVDTAAVTCQIGNRATALAEMRAALADSTAQFGPDGALTQGIKSGALADCLIAARQFDEAEALLTGLDIDLIQRLNGSSNYGAQVQLSLAHIAVQRGDAAKAARHLAAAEPAIPELEREAYWRDFIAAIRRKIENL